MVQLRNREGHIALADIPALRRQPLRAGHVPVDIALRIENFVHIETAYGSAIAGEAVEHVRRVLQRILKDDGSVGPAAGGVVRAAIRDAAVFGEGGVDGAASWIGVLCDELTLAPVRTSAGPIHIWLSGGLSGGDTDRIEIGADQAVTDREDHAEISVNPTFCGAAIGGARGAAARYRCDMGRVAAWLEAFDAPAAPAHGAPIAPQLFWQPVCDAHEPSRVLYHEALLRPLSRDGADSSFLDEILAFERLGFARLLDRRIVTMVLAELQASRDVVLGVNISAQSAEMDGWWGEIEQWLRHNRDVAARLIIEITETAAFPNISAAVTFASRMKRAGCRIAVDDFGAGHASIRQAIALAPDIVKVDGVFLRQAARCERARATFGHLTGIARAMAATVIVEGVESANDAQIAIDAGADGVQGYHCGRPSLSACWKVAGRVPQQNRNSPSPRREAVVTHRHDRRVGAPLLTAVGSVK